MAHHHHHSTALQIYSCALTGLSPLTDAVVTPSGYICSRKLLLTKLAENGGIDPFDDQGVRRLEESHLIDLATSTSSSSSAAIIPPRAPKSTSLPNLLSQLQSEFDAVLLELYDTRHALEETRRELSLALYQNDAAIRVVARLAQERDESRAVLERYLTSEDSRTPLQQPPELEQQPQGETTRTQPQKRAREDGGELDVIDDDTMLSAPKKTAKISADINEDRSKDNDNVVDLSKIPSAELEVMGDTWKQLTAGRRAIAKLKRSPEEIAKNEALLTRLETEDGDGDGGESKKVNLGKASAKAGVLCMTSLRCGGAMGKSSTEYLITGGHDKNAQVYDVSLGKIVATLTGASGDIHTVHGKEVKGGQIVQIVTGSTDGHIRLYELLVLSENSKETEATLIGVAKLEMGVPVNVVLHPSSTHESARILVASSSGTLELYKWSTTDSDQDENKMKLITRLESSLISSSDDNNMETIGKPEYTSGCMHPDGFIYIAGTSNGSLLVWDLKSQSVAGTLKGQDHLPVNCIAISENGYHVATSSSSSTNGLAPISIWDLRKLKLSATITPTTDVGTSVISMAFDPTASYLAYSGESCSKICVAKDWDRIICTLTPSNKGVTKRGKKDASGGTVVSGAVVWGGQGFGLKEGEGGDVWLAVGCDGERPVRFWGLN